MVSLRSPIQLHPKYNETGPEQFHHSSTNSLLQVIHSAIDSLHGQCLLHIPTWKNPVLQRSSISSISNFMNEMGWGSILLENNCLFFLAFNILNLRESKQFQCDKISIPINCFLPKKKVHVTWSHKTPYPYVHLWKDHSHTQKVQMVALLCRFNSSDD